MFSVYLRRAEQRLLGSVSVKITILHMSTGTTRLECQEALAAYKVDADSITLTVKQEFAAKGKMKAKKGVAIAAANAVKEVKAA